MGKEERERKDLIKALDRNTRAIEDLARELKRGRVTGSEKPSLPSQPEGSKEFKG